MRAKDWLLAIFSIALIADGGCSIPDTSQRGYGSRQALHVREDGLGLRSFSYDLSGIYLAHAIPGIMTSNGVTAPYDRTLLDLTTGVDRTISPGVIEADLLPVATGTGRSLVLQHFPDDASIPPMLTSSTVSFVTLTFLDEVTGTKVDIPSVRALAVSLGPTRSDPILVSKPSDPTSNVPFYGVAEALVPMTMPAVNFVAGRDHHGFVALTHSSDDKGQVFTRFPFDTTVPAMAITPAVLDAQSRTIVLGDDGAAPDTSVATVPNDNVSPAIYCPPASPGAGTPLPNCLLFYDRDLANDASAGFVHFLDDTRDMQLPGTLTNHLADTLTLSPSGQDMFWLQTEGGTQTRVYTWHLGDTHAASCVLSRTADRRNFSQSAWQPGTGRFVTVAQSNSQSASMPATWALIEGTAGAGCQIVTTGDNLINQIEFSPSGNQIALLETDPVGNSKVYLGPPDGTAPTVASTGSYYFNIGYLDAQHLLLWHSNTDGYSLSWLDVTAVPAVEHAIADRVRWDARGSWAWLTPKWVLLADADLQQDGSYSLDVVNIETGEERLVSRGVVDFRVSWPVPPLGATELVVAYTVRSRTASSQDGIWVAHLPLAEFAD